MLSEFSNNEINDKIGNKTILHKYEIKDSCKEVINILFSSEFEPPVNTFKHIVITISRMNVLMIL
jgi:hypothetical protein